jgi:hypothetical protein
VESDGLRLVAIFVAGRLLQRKMHCIIRCSRCSNGGYLQRTYKKEEVKDIFHGDARNLFNFFRGIQAGTGTLVRFCWGLRVAPYPALVVKGAVAVGCSCHPADAGRYLKAPGEAESGSAGVQPDKEYPGRRCAAGASDPWG